MFPVGYGPTWEANHYPCMQVAFICFEELSGDQLLITCNISDFACYFAYTMTYSSHLASKEAVCFTCSDTEVRVSSSLCEFHVISPFVSKLL